MDKTTIIIILSALLTFALGYILMRSRPKKDKKTTNTSNVVLVILGLFLLAFIVSMIVIYCVKGSVPDVLIQCVLGQSVLETVALAGIKISKVFATKNHKEDTKND